MHRIAAVLIAGILAVSPVWAQIAPKVKVLAKEAITALTDDQLKDTLLDTQVDLEAFKMFHTTSGFSPKQFDAYRDLLKFRYQLLAEMHLRNLDIPPQLEH